MFEVEGVWTMDGERVSEESVITDGKGFGDDGTEKEAAE